MSEPNDNWEALQSQWQSYQPDMQKIKKKINWVTWRMGAILLVDVLFVLAYFPFLYYRLVENQEDWLLNSWDLLIGCLVVYGVYIDFKIRLPIFRAQGESTRDVLALYFNRVKAGVELGRFCKNFSFMLLAAFLLLVGVNQVYPSANPRISEPGFIVFGILWISGFVVLSIWYQKKKQKEHDNLKKLWQEYLE